MSKSCKITTFGLIWVFLLLLVWSRSGIQEALRNTVALEITRSAVGQRSISGEGAVIEKAQSGLGGVWAGPGLARLAGFSLLQQGRIEQATAMLERSDHDDWLASFFLGIAYDRLGRHEDAVRAWRQARAWPYFVAMGRAPYEAQEFAKACHFYLRAVEIAPEVARTQMYAGNCYLRQGDFPRAERAYQRAIQLGPDEGEYYINLSNLYSIMEHNTFLAYEVLRDCLNKVASSYWRALCRQSLQQLPID